MTQSSDNMPQPVRSGEINGKHIHVFDNLVDPSVIVQINQALDGSAFTRNEIARPDTGQHRHWAHNMNLDAARQLPLHAPTISATRIFQRHDVDYSVYRAYTNCVSYGDHLYTHTDCMPGAGELTALWFISESWDPEWGGETLFFDDNKEALFVAAARPGRLVLFDGEILHCGKAPNRMCLTPRYTYAMKLEPVKK